MSVIRTENLGKTYRGGTVALRGLDLEVGEAEVFGFSDPMAPASRRPFSCCSISFVRVRAVLICSITR